MNAVLNDPSPAARLRVLLVDDHPVFLSAMEAIFRMHVKSAIVSLADSIAQVRQGLRYSPPPDLVFLDLELPDSRGLDTVRVMSASMPLARIVVLTGYTAASVKRACLKLGAHEVLDKSMRQDGLVNAVLSQVESLTDIPHQVRQASPAQARLSRRQLEVLALIVRGYSNRDIAAQLHITEATVKAHTSAIFRCLGVRTRAELIARSVQRSIE